MAQILAFPKPKIRARRAPRITMDLIDPNCPCKECREFWSKPEHQKEKK